MLKKENKQFKLEYPYLSFDIRNYLGEKKALS